MRVGGEVVDAVLTAVNAILFLAAQCKAPFVIVTV